MTQSFARWRKVGRVHPRVLCWTATGPGAAWTSQAYSGLTRSSFSRNIPNLSVEPFAPRIDLLRSLERNHFWFRGRRELLRRLLRRFVSPRAKILDIGSGTGFFLQELEREGFRAVGVDPLASRASPIAVRGDGIRLPFLHASFDAVTLLDVMEHLDDAALLREAARVLTPGGVVVITVPASDRLWSSRDVAAGHLRRYSRKLLTDTAARAGLTMQMVTYYQFLLFPLLVAARTFGRSSPGMREAEEKPGALVNALFGALNILEARCAPAIRWPWGSSLVAVCTKS